jgi:hypothetical protein
LVRVLVGVLVGGTGVFVRVLVGVLVGGTGVLVGVLVDVGVLVGAGTTQRAARNVTLSTVVPSWVCANLIECVPALSVPVSG